MIPPHRILVVAPSWIGDTVMMQPLLARLQARIPNSQTDVLAPAWSAPLLARMAEVHHSIASPFTHGSFGLGERWRLGRQIAANCYQQAYVLPNTWKSALVPLFAGISHRTGYLGEARYGLLNDIRRLNAAAMPRLVDRYAHLADPADPANSADSDLPPSDTPAPKLQSAPDQQDQARYAFGLSVGTSLAIFCPGAEFGPAKRWPARHFALVATTLQAKDWQVALVGSHKDAAIGEEIVRLSEGKVRNLCGQTNLMQAIDLIASAQFVLTNDSGLMHVAAALDRPLVALFGSSSPAYTPPLSARAKILSLNLPCAPCFQRQCPLGHLNCLNQLEPQTVLDAFFNHA